MRLILLHTDVCKALPQSTCATELSSDSPVRLPRTQPPPSCEIRLNSARQRGSFGAKNPAWHLGAMTAFGHKWEKGFSDVPGCDPGGTSHPCPGPTAPSLGYTLQTSEARQWVGVENPAPPMGGSPATQLQVMWGDFSNDHSRPNVTK